MPSSDSSRGRTLRAVSGLGVARFSTGGDAVTKPLFPGKLSAAGACRSAGMSATWPGTAAGSSQNCGSG